MNKNSMDNDVITVQHPLAEDYPYADNQEHGNSKQNQLNSAKSVNRINEVEKSPTTPTPLYVFSVTIIIYMNNIFLRKNSFWSKYRYFIVAGAFALFIILAIIAAICVLIVHFTSRKATGMFFFFLVYKLLYKQI